MNTTPSFCFLQSAFLITYTAWVAATFNFIYDEQHRIVFYVIWYVLMVCSTIHKVLEDFYLKFKQETFWCQN